MNDSAEPISPLIDAGILDLTDEIVAISAAFTQSIEEHREGWRDSESAIVELVGESTASRLDETEREELLAIHGAITDATSTLPAVDQLKLLVLVDSMLHAPVAAGVPDPFLPIPGNRVEFYTSLYQRALVYVWRDDCDPCDAMYDRLTELFWNRDDDVMKFAIDGSEWGAALAESYNVVGAPTLLFVANGTVDVRLVGPRGTTVIENELYKLKRRSRTT